MKKSMPPLFLFLRVVFSIRFIIQALLFTIAYLSIVFIVSNFKMLGNILSLHYSLWLKIEVILFSFWGYFHSSNYLSASTTIAVSLLFGFNAAPICSRSCNVALRQKRNRIAAFVSALSVFASGCTICGISLFSTLGAGTLFAFLPLHGYEIPLTTLILLLGALYFNIQSQTKPCSIPRK